MSPSHHPRIPPPGWAALVHLVSDRMESVRPTPGVQIPNAPGDSAWRWNVGMERICVFDQKHYSKVKPMEIDETLLRTHIIT